MFLFIIILILNDLYLKNISDMVYISLCYEKSFSSKYLSPIYKSDVEGL